MVSFTLTKPLSTEESELLQELEIFLYLYICFCSTAHPM